MTRPTRHLWTASVLILGLALVAATAGAGEWKGTEEKVEGVLHIENPAEAIDPPMTIDLEEVYRLGGWSEDQFFGVITGMLQDDDGNVYILDAQLKEIQIYDSAGMYVDTIGREGEAPGEFQNASAMFWMPDGNIGVLQTFPGRVVRLTPDGEPLDDFELPPLEENDQGGFRILFGAQRAGDKLAFIEAVNKPAQDSFEQVNYLSLYDPETSSFERLFSASSHMSMTKTVISEKEWDSFRNRWLASSSGRVYSVNDISEYAITVYGNDGSVDRVIERAHEPFARTEEQKEEILEIYKGFTQRIPFPNKEYEIEENHPPITFGGLKERPDGSLWVLTSRGSEERPADEIGTFDVYDPKGRLVRQVTLKGQFDDDNDAIFFVGERIYVITDFLSAAMAAQGGGAAETDEEGDAEPMAVICYRSDELAKAAGIPAGKGTDSR